MQRFAWPLLALLVGLLVLAPVAEAAKRPPRAVLRAAESQARLGPWSYSWSYPSGDKCGAIVADGFPDYGFALSVAHRHARPRVVFLRDRKPRVTRFRAYRKLNRSGLPAGEGERVASAIRPKREDGEIVAWKVRFHVDVVERPYFDLDVRFPLRRLGGCPEGGNASYAFGIERR